MPVGKAEGRATVEAERATRVQQAAERTRARAYGWTIATCENNRS